jgi:hypothetical protein
MNEREVFAWPYLSPFAALVIESMAFIIGGFFVSHALSWLGILLILVGVGVIVLGYVVETHCTIICTQADFTVATKKRLRKTRRTTYRWSDVCETRFREISRGGFGAFVMRYFAADTDSRRAFEMKAYWQDDFAGLIATFNRMTPHLPYIWQPQGPGSTRLWRYGFDQYRRVPRETVTTTH